MPMNRGTRHDTTDPARAVQPVKWGESNEPVISH